MAFFEYRYQGYAVSFGGALGDAFAESVRRTAGLPRFRGWRIRNAVVDVEPVDGSDFVDVYASAEIDGDPVVGERAFRALVRGAASAVGVRVLDGGDLDDRSLGVRDLELRSSGCCG